MVLCCWLVNHIANESLLSKRAKWDSVDGDFACLDTFFSTSSIMVSAHKTDFWLVDWIHHQIGFLQPSLIFAPGSLFSIWASLSGLICQQYLCGIGVFRGFRASMFGTIRISLLQGS
jgi:hypothetical protein